MQYTFTWTQDSSGRGLRGVMRREALACGGIEASRPRSRGAREGSMLERAEDAAVRAGSWGEGCAGSWGEGCVFLSTEPRVCVCVPLRGLGGSQGYRSLERPGWPPECGLNTL